MKNSMNAKIDLIIRALASADDGSWQDVVAEAKKLLAESGECFDPDKEIRNAIEDALDDCGFLPNIKGYDRLVDAIFLAVKDPSIVDHITKGLYIDVAKICNTTPSRVERAIRHSIERAFNMGNRDYIASYIGNIDSCDSGKCTNSQFVAGMAKYIRRKFDM